MKNWLEKTAAEIGDAIGAGKVDPVELAQASLDAAGARPDIYARLTPERALAEARAAARRADEGRRLSPLDGVPISWKDLFDTAGVGTEAGSRLLEGRVPDRDARVLKNATAAGLVCIGKTHMSELAFSGLGLNPMTASPPCVNDPEAVSGGSSSGAATSVAFGTVPAAIGSDTGGSVRIPAAWNDLVGLKTTSRRLSLEGVVPLAEKFDTVGPICRSVADAALLLAALESRGAPDLRGVTLEGLRLGVLQNVVLDDLRDAPRKAFFDTVERLRAAGAIIEDVDAPEIDEAMPLSGILYTAEAYGIWKDVIESAPDKMYGPIRERFRAGREHGAPEYVAAWRTLDRCRARWRETTAAFDAILTPASPNLPPEKARLEKEGEYYVTENLLTLRNTRVGNLMGVAALSLPTGVPSCGLQVLGEAMGEARLLRVGAAIEAALARD